jgi:hypothetical protein
MVMVLFSLKLSPSTKRRLVLDPCGLPLLKYSRQPSRPGALVRSRRCACSGWSSKVCEGRFADQGDSR